MSEARDELTRLANGRWAPGYCPNPQGRPPTNAAIERVMRQMAWHRLVEIDKMAAHGPPAQASSAQHWWMDHVIGKPVAKLEAVVTDIGAQHLLAVSTDPASAGLVEAVPAPAAPEPLPLLEAAGIDAPVQYAPQPMPEWER